MLRKKASEKREFGSPLNRAIKLKGKNRSRVVTRVTRGYSGNISTSVTGEQYRNQFVGRRYSDIPYQSSLRYVYSIAAASRNRCLIVVSCHLHVG